MLGNENRHITPLIFLRFERAPIESLTDGMFTGGKQPRGLFDTNPAPSGAVSHDIHVNNAVSLLPAPYNPLSDPSLLVGSQPRASSTGEEEGPGVDGSKEPPGLRREAGAKLSDARMYSGPRWRYPPRVASLR